MRSTRSVEFMLPVRIASTRTSTKLKPIMADSSEGWEGRERSSCYHPLPGPCNEFPRPLARAGWLQPTCEESMISHDHHGKNRACAAPPSSKRGGKRGCNLQKNI